MRAATGGPGAGPGPLCSKHPRSAGCAAMTEPTVLTTSSPGPCALQRDGRISSTTSATWHQHTIGHAPPAGCGAIAGVGWAPPSASRHSVRDSG